MAKITLNTIVASFASTSLFNTNFASIATELNSNVLYRNNPAGEANQMSNDLDMNSNDILNGSTVNADIIVLNGTQITATGTTSLPSTGVTYSNTTSGLTATNAQTAIDEIADAHTGGSNHGRNLIINGDLSVAQRGTSFTGTSEYTLDRVRQERLGTTCTTTQQTHTLGQTAVPGNPKNFLRSVVTTSAGAGNFMRLEFRFEDLTSFSGSQVTLSFSANADASKNIATEFTQNFGTGGSPSTAVTGIGIATHALTTTDARFTKTVTITSLSGKTLGTNGDDYLEVVVWLDAGSNFDARTSTLGQQSGTFEISNIQLEFGDTATDSEFVHPATQLARCRRYFERVDSTDSIFGFITNGYVRSTTLANGVLRFLEKRAVPSVSSSGAAALRIDSSASDQNGTANSFDNITRYSSRMSVTGSGLTAGQGCNLLFSGATTFFIDIDAEL